MPASIPIVFCFDIEPDERVDIPAPGSEITWDGVPGTIDFLDAYRDRLAEATGAPVAFNWFVRMDPAIKSLHGDARWAGETFGKELDRLAAQGDAIGLHTHALRWNPAISNWVVDHGNREWLRECVESSYEAFRDWRGEPCRLNRMGDWFMGDGVMEDVERAGATIELTVEPGQKPIQTNTPDLEHTGGLPDYTRAPRTPYRPSRGHFLRPAKGADDARGLWEMPVVAVDIRPITPLPRRVLRFARYPFRPPFRPWPLWAPYDGDLFWELIERDLLRQPRACLVFATRSDTAINPGGRQRMSDKLDALMRRPLARRVRFATPQEALRLLGHSQ